MDITPLIPEDRLIIEGYGAGGFRVSGERYEGSILLTPAQVLSWQVESFQVFDIESLAPLKGLGDLSGIILLGCGRSGQFIAPSLRQEIRDVYGLVVEAMDSGAACRTYNVLMSEDRPDVAAHIKID